MNVRLLKAKRIERDIRQSEVAHYLGITPKSACEKENSQRCRYTVEEMLKLSEYLKMSLTRISSKSIEIKQFQPNQCSQTA